MSAASSNLIERLNRGSLERSFTPQLDIDWSAATTDAEYEALFAEWNIFAGSALEPSFAPAQRVAFAKYQQMNLMLFTGLLERHGLHRLSELYDLDASRAFQDALGHFIKEETYHTMMFGHAVDTIQASMAGLPPLPEGAIHRYFRWLFAALGLVPGRRLRVSLTVMLFRFAEQVTMIANQAARRRVPRAESLVPRVWACHALDEARHLAFDDWVLERHGLGRRWNWLTGLLALPMCVFASVLLHRNELWAARQLGGSVRLWSLPHLARTTTAPFKRRVFALMGAVFRGTTARAHLGDDYGATPSPKSP